MPSLPAAVKPISALDVCRLANSSRPGRPSFAVAPPPMLSGAGASTSAPPMGLYEDTEFFGGRGSGGARRGSSRPQQPEGFCIHEDTDVVVARAPGGPNRIDMYEDTVCVGLGAVAAASAQGGMQQGRMGFTRQQPQQGGGGLIYEDTEFGFVGRR